MRKLGITILAGITAILLGACTKEAAPQQTISPAETETLVPTLPSTEELPKIEEESTPQEKELINMLDEIQRDGRVGTAGCSLTATKLAAHLMNWGVGTPLTVEQIKDITVSWLQPKGESEQSDFAENLSLVRDTYNQLLGENAEALLEEAGVIDAAYPWSNEPIETVEAVMQAVFGE